MPLFSRLLVILFSLSCLTLQAESGYSLYSVENPNPDNPITMEVLREPIPSTARQETLTTRGVHIVAIPNEKSATAGTPQSLTFTPTEGKDILELRVQYEIHYPQKSLDAPVVGAEIYREIKRLKDGERLWIFTPQRIYILQPKTLQWTGTV